MALAGKMTAASLAQQVAIHDTIGKELIVMSCGGGEIILSMPT